MKKTTKEKKKPIVFSAVQPTGKLTIGNYIGAIKQWINMQEKYECIYCIADQHAITVQHDPKELKKNILDTLALYLSCGIDYKKNTIFIQSQIPEHSQLSWILNCYSYHGELKRMTQFKKKIIKKKIKNGIFTYPILMASDILLYQANKVPIGKDQKQHLELTKNIADRFNKIYGNIFTIPIPCFSKTGKKIMSLQETKKKMSKSDKNKNNIINLLEHPNTASKKIKKAITDSEFPPKIYYNTKNKPNISNLINIFSNIENIKISKIEEIFRGKNYAYFKKKISESLIEFLNKIQKKFRTIRKEEIFLNKILIKGKIKAKKKAKKMLKKVYKAVGFYEH